MNGSRPGSSGMSGSRPGSSGMIGSRTGSSGMIRHESPIIRELPPRCTGWEVKNIGGKESIYEHLDKNDVPAGVKKVRLYFLVFAKETITVC